MQEAGHELERSTALGVLMDNEERRLMEAVRRCDVWATCASLVLGVQVELLVGTAQAVDFEEWHETFRIIYTAASSLSLMCMGWVAYDVLRAAEEAQAIAHARPAYGGPHSLLHFNKARCNIDGGVYPPLQAMRAAVGYLHQCLRDMRQVFNFGLLMAAATFFSFVGTYAAPNSPSFIVGVAVVALVTAVRQAWRRRLRQALRAPQAEENSYSEQSWKGQPLPDGRVGGRTTLLLKGKVPLAGRPALRLPSREHAADARGASVGTPSTPDSASTPADASIADPAQLSATAPQARVGLADWRRLLLRGSALRPSGQQSPPRPRLVASPTVIRLRQQIAEMSVGAQGHLQPVAVGTHGPPLARAHSSSCV
jgi:hypothetical protein